MSNFFPQGQAYSRDILLPQSTGGQDAEYTAAEAQLRADITRKYQDILQQLGHKTGSGEFMPGEVELQANRQRAELGRNRQLAAEETTQQSQREGTLFSGLRAQNQARAEHPFVQALADLDVDVPKQLNRLYEEAGRTLGDYTLQNNLLLADAASRAAARAMAAAYAGGGGGGGGGSYEDVAREQSQYDYLQNIPVPAVPAAAPPPQQVYVPTNPGWGAAGTAAKKQAPKPGDPNWAQAGQYGWLG